MLKIARNSRRQNDSLYEKTEDHIPVTPLPTPSSSYISESFLEKQLHGGGSLHRAVEGILLTPDNVHVENEEEATRFSAVADLCSNFPLSDEQLQHIEKRMIMEINWGLGQDTNPSSNIKSYITYVSQLPTGRESGEYLALDLGGTNFRVILIRLDSASTSIRMTASKHAVSEELMTGPGENLFNFMVDKLREFMIDHNLFGKKHFLGFTFSFPTVQHSLASADLATWTKGYICDGVVGEDVVRLLEKSIHRYSDMNITVSAILNDTTGCLIACAYKRHDCAIGVIIGTGTNASYVEDINNVELYNGHKGGKKEVVINTEWGALGNTGSLDFIRTKYDHLVDNNSKNHGKQVYEKLISGMYLGELTRYILLDATEKKHLFNGHPQAVKILREKEVFQTRHISEIESDNPGDFNSCWSVLAELKLDKITSNFDCVLLKYICQSVAIRASVLAAAGVAALLNKMGRRSVTVGMDGSLYKFHPHFQSRMTSKIRDLVDKSINFQLVLSEDGSGRGAGLAAAVSSS